MAQIKVSEYILRRLSECGCKHVYGVPAASASNFFDAIEVFDGVETVITSSELEAGYAADGYGRAKRLGATAVSYGVGTQVFVGAIAGALVEKVPLLVVNGGPTTKELTTESDYGVLFTHSTGRPYTDLKVLSEVSLAAQRLSFPSDQIGEQHTGSDIDALFLTAIEKKGPVYLEISNEEFDSLIEEPLSTLEELLSQPDDQGLSDFIELARDKITQASNPVLLIGVEVVRNQLLPSLLRELIETLKIPYFTTVLGKSVIDESNAYFAGTFDSELAPTSVHEQLYQSDAIVSLGCVFGVSYTTLVPEKNDDMIRLESGKGRIGNTIIEGVPLSLFMNELKEFGDLGNARNNRAITKEVYSDRYLQRRYWVESQSETESLTHDNIFVELDSFLSNKTDTPYTVMVDTCLGAYPGADLPMKGQHNYLADSVWLSIGWSAAACTGVFQGSGKRPIVIVGDGGFQTIAQTLSTIAKYNIPVIMIIIDNGFYAIEQFVLDPCYFLDDKNEAISYVYLNGWNYAAMGEVFGLSNGGSFSVDTRSELSSLLEEAHKNSQGSYIIAAKVPNHDLPPENFKYAEETCPTWRGD